MIAYTTINERTSMIQSTLKTLACKYIKLLIMVDERFYAGVTSTNYVFPVFAVLSFACPNGRWGQQKKVAHKHTKQADLISVCERSLCRINDKLDECNILFSVFQSILNVDSFNFNRSIFHIIKRRIFNIKSLYSPINCFPIDSAREFHINS